MSRVETAVVRRRVETVARRVRWFAADGAPLPLEQREDESELEKAIVRWLEQAPAKKRRSPQGEAGGSGGSQLQLADT